MAGYTRNDTANNIADGNVINAAPLDGEFNAIEAAFNVSSGHTHDGSTTGDGGPVSKLGPSAQLEQTSSALTPSSNNAIDLGTSSAEFKDLYLNGVAYIDKLTVAASNGGTDGVGSHLEPTATATYNLGSSTYAFNTAFVTALNVRKNDAPVVTLTNLSTDMTATEIVGSIIWESLDTQQSGVDLAQIDAVIVDSLDDAGDDQVKLTFKTGNAESLTLAMTLQSDDIIAPDDVALQSDASVLSFGADNDVTLTHVHDTGLLLNSTMAIQFNDASQFINAPNATTLDINATDEVEVNATLMDVNANLDVSGTYTGGGLMTTGGNIVIPDAGQIGSASDTNAITISSGGVVAVTATTANTDATDGALTVAGGASVAADLSVGDDLRLASDGSILSFGTDGEVSLTHVHNTGLQVTGNMVMMGTSSAAGSIQFREDTDNGTNAVTLIGPASTADITLTLPSTAGTLALTTDIASSGISSGNIATFGSGVVDNDFLRIDGTTVEGRSASEVLSDIGAITASSTDTLTNKSLTAPVLTGSSSAAGSILFKEDTDNGTNAVTLIGPAATTDVTITLPNVTANTSLAALNLAQEYTASQNFDEQSLSDGANIDWNLQTQQVATVTLGGNRTFNAPSNHVAGLVCILTIVQDGTGSRTATFNSAFKFTGGSAPTLSTTASARDILVFISDGTNLREMGRSLNPS